MKLDENMIEKIVDEVSVYDFERSYIGARQQIRKFLSNLDLVIKSGDSSQGTLVENNPNQK